ncbi:MAG: Spy/CpxP family protein refolding chaperone [Candidatus Marinimicrobia bacterium]|nr:Spy/CpxP family protein refolding chaperone [Candidatus Neomarinimicrobiota bacterium]
MKIILIVLAGIFILMAVTGCGHLRHKKGHCVRNPEKHIPKIVKIMGKKLDLTDTQKTQVKSILDDLASNHGDMKTMKDEMHKEIILQLGKENVDVNALNNQMDEKASTVNSMRYKVVDAFAEFHRILTPEQRKKLAVHIEKYGSRHGKCCG